jgi:hypothetical protein
MSLTDDNTNGGSASAPAPTPYVFLIFAFVLQFLGLAIDLDMLYSYRSLVNMVSLISMFSAIFCSLFSWIKSSRKLLIFPTTYTIEKSCLHNGDGIRTVNLKNHNVANQRLDADMDTEVKSSYRRWYPEAYCKKQASAGLEGCLPCLES